MPKFVHKPVYVEANQWHPGTPVEGLVEKIVPDSRPESIYGVVKTNHGDVVAEPGDLIIKTEAGEYYPCKPEVFNANYDRVDEADGEPQPPQDEPEHESHDEKL